jgi:hypothetical protein
MDLFVVPSVTFELLYAFIIVRLARRDLVWINVTSHPTAEWITHQITEAFPWNEAPRYLIRDRDQVYGTAVRRRLRTMGIREADRAQVSLAKRRRREVDWIHPPRVHRPYHRAWRGPSASCPEVLCDILQCRQDTSIAE